MTYRLENNIYAKQIYYSFANFIMLSNIFYFFSKENFYQIYTFILFFPKYQNNYILIGVHLSINATDIINAIGTYKEDLQWPISKRYPTCRCTLFSKYPQIGHLGVQYGKKPEVFNFISKIFNFGKKNQERILFYIVNYVIMTNLRLLR